MLKKRRLKFGLVVIAVLAALVVIGGGSAGLPDVHGTPYPSSDALGNNCPGFGISERHYCLVVTTYSNLAKVGGIEVDLTMQNYDQSSLTNPSATIDLLAGLPAGNTFSFVTSDTGRCTGTTTGASCTFPNIAGEGSAAGTGIPPGPHNDATVRLFFRVNAPDVSVLHFTATGTAKENGNDNGGAANVEGQTVADAPMTFGNDPTQTATFAFGGDKPTLTAQQPSNEPSFNSSVQFAVPAGSAPFQARFSTDQGPTACFGGITCSGLTLTTDLNGQTFPNAPYILWQAVINASSANVDAIHYYNPVQVTASPSTKTFATTTSFASCDGVRFDSPPAGLQSSPNNDYFVVKGTATATSFQVAATATGKALSFTGSGTFSAACIRVIGDQKSEQTKSCDPLNPPSQVPALYAAKQSNTTVKICLWDTANGFVNT